MLMSPEGRSVQVQVLRRPGQDISIVYVEQPEGQDMLVNRCLPKVWILCMGASDQG